MLEKGPLTALLGGKDLLSHPSLQKNKKVSFLKRLIEFYKPESKVKIKFYVKSQIGKSNFIIRAELSLTTPSLCALYMYVCTSLNPNIDFPIMDLAHRDLAWTLDSGLSRVFCHPTSESSSEKLIKFGP